MPKKINNLLLLFFLVPTFSYSQAVFIPPKAEVRRGLPIEPKILASDVIVQDFLRLTHGKTKDYTTLVTKFRKDLNLSKPPIQATTKSVSEIKEGNFIFELIDTDPKMKLSLKRNEMSEVITSYDVFLFRKNDEKEKFVLGNSTWVKTCKNLGFTDNLIILDTGKEFLFYDFPLKKLKGINLVGIGVDCKTLLYVSSNKKDYELYKVILKEPKI